MSHTTEVRISFSHLRANLVNLQLLKDLDLNRKSKMAPSMEAPFQYSIIRQM